MGLFSKLFGQGDKTNMPDEQKPQQITTPCKTETELIERFGGISFDKQFDLGEVIGDNSWNVDMKKGEISFGANITFPIQVLGTISHSSDTWLWAWANTKSGLSETVTKHANELKKYGEENEIDLLRNSEFGATKNDLHLIGLIASGMFGSSGYYIADYGQGAMVVTIKSDKVDKTRKENHHRVLTVFPQLISQFHMNHKLALTNYLNAKGYVVMQNGTNISATKNAEKITAEFDDLSRMTKLNG